MREILDLFARRATILGAHDASACQELDYDSVYLIATFR